MTTIATHRPTTPITNHVVMFIAAIGVAVMIIATNPFDVGAAPNRAGPDVQNATTAEIPRPQPAGWCCLGSKPAEWPGQGMTDVGEVTSSVEMIPPLNALSDSSLGRVSGGVGVSEGQTK